MPFKSEKQRRYLWANEPEIARDWADTYGSRIKKDDGGIMRESFRVGAAATGGMKGTSDKGMSTGDVGGGGKGSKNGFTDHGGKAHQKAATKAVKEAKTRDRQDVKEKAIKKYSTNPYGLTPVKKGFFHDQRQKMIKNFIKRNKYKNLKKTGIFGKHGFKGFFGEIFHGMSPPEEVENFDVDSIREIASKYGGLLNKTQVKGLKGFRRDLDFEKKYKHHDPTQKEFDEYYGLNKPPQPGGDGQGGGYMGYPSYAAWLAAQGGGGGGGATTPTPDTPSDFQLSLTGTADTPDYYVGNNPLASNITWGKQMGVDPRTMGLTSWAAEGGRIPAAFGGIMDTETGRKAYGFGSIFKKIGRAAKKVFKSPIGKAALLAGGAYMLGGANFLGGQGMFQSGQGLQRFANLKNLKDIAGFKQLLTTDGEWSPWKLGIGAASVLPFFMGGEKEDDEPKFDYEGAKNKYAEEMMRIKRGVMAGSLDPNEFSYLPSNYTYTGAEGGRARLSNGGDPLLREEYDKYVFEMEEMGLQPMTFEEFKAQARAGMYAGGQSTPSDYTMEDAMMTTTQDKLGGITDVMKQADLYRQGDVGQFYAAQGGRIGYAGGGAGSPPITLTQAPRAAPQMPGPQGLQTPTPGPQAPQRPTPMPAPQPNQMGRGMMGGMMGGMNPMMGRGMMGGMNPMMGRGMMGGMNPMMGRGMNPIMNRPMMKAMPARKMAQEGGLMDLGGMEKDYRNDGGFVPLGGEEKADDVPARLSKNEFVFTADAVRGAGGGDIDKGAEIMENVMKNLEQGGQVSEETQGLSGAQEMFGVSERLSEVV